MALFLIERQYAEELEIAAADVANIQRINADVGVNWLFSFLSAGSQEDLLPLRGPEPRRDSHGRTPGPAAGGCGD